MYLQIILKFFKRKWYITTRRISTHSLLSSLIINSCNCAFALIGEEYITNVRIANESREVDHRENEGINKENIFQQLDEEAQSAIELFNTIAAKWTVNFLFLLEMQNMSKIVSFNSQFNVKMIRSK